MPSIRRRSLSRPPLAVLALGAVTVAVVVIAVLAVGSPSASGVQERRATVTRGVVQSTVSGSGSLSPANQLDLSFKTSGVVSAVYVKPGEHVSEGEVLAALDPSSAQVTLAKAKADLETAQDTLDGVSSASASVEAPDSSDSDAKQNEDSGSSMSVAAAQAAVDSAELAVDDAEKALAATKLRAPMAGTIAEVSGAVGDGISAGSSNTPSSDGGDGSDGSSSSGFITLAQLSRFKMEVSLSESDIGKVKNGQAATVAVNAASGEEFEAHVTSIAVLPTSSASGDSSAVSYPVELTLDQTGKKLKAGMSASADIVVARASGLMIPTQALQGSTVTVERDGKRSTQRVQTGVAGDSMTQVLGGLEAGDQVIVTSSAAAAASGTSGNNERGFGGARGLGGGGLGGGGAAPQVFRAGPGGGGPPP